MRHTCGTRSKLLSSLPVSGLVALALAGCGQTRGGETESATSDVLSENGLRTINGFRAHNGFDPTSGLSVSGGLASAAGLANGTGLMSTLDGRTTVTYLARCALPAGHSIVKTDQYGTAYTFTGTFGVGPDWETMPASQTSQMWVSACMLAMVNTTGQHYPIWIDGQPTSIGWGTDPGYPYQEGSFFGNIFSSTSPAYYCEGRDFGVNPIPGRIGSAQTSPPYTDIAPGKACTTFCTPADYPHATDGSKACSGWNQVFTIYHQ